MRNFLDVGRVAAVGALVAFAAPTPSHALLIVPTFDLSNDAGSLNNEPNPGAVEADIQTAINTIDSLYSNPGTIDVLFNFNSGVLGESQSGETFVPYNQYTSQLAAIAAASPTNYVLNTAVPNFPKGNTADWVLATTALLRVGMSFTGAGTTPCYNAAGVYVNGCGQIYDGVITIGSFNSAQTASPGPGQNAEATSVVEHELDEVLGGGGTGTTLGEPSFSAYVTGTVIGPTDLYRYQSTGSTCANVDSTPSFTTDPSAVACYSINGGQNALVQMNEVGGGSDYGDFANVAGSEPDIQDAFYPGTTPDYSISSPEFVMMQSIGYDPLPEPSTLALLPAAAGLLGWLRRRR